jgi:hypothetical protein
MRGEHLLRRELKRIENLVWRSNRRSRLTDEQRNLLLGAEWALQYALARRGSRVYPAPTALIRAMTGSKKVGA